MWIAGKKIENTEKQKEENRNLPDPTSQAMWIADQKVLYVNRRCKTTAYISIKLAHMLNCILLSFVSRSTLITFP